MENSLEIRRTTHTTRKYGLMVLITTIALFSTIVVCSPLTMVFASTNVIEDFDGDDNQSSGSNQPLESQESDPSQESSDNESVTSDGTENQPVQDDSDNSADIITNKSQTNDSSESEDQRIQLVDPNAYNYQTNPAKSTVEILVSPTQYIRTIVKDSFMNGVPNIPIEVKVKNPFNVVTTLSGTTDSNGRNQITVPVMIPGSWTAEVKISSPAAVGGPFSETISWNAVLTNTPTTPPSQPPNPPAGIQYDSKIAYQTVDRSNDPRQQILTTVKDSSGTGVKDVKLTIKLTNSDGQSATFSRITDANGVDEFVTPVEKDGNWKAFVSVKDSIGNIVYTKEHLWKAIP